MKNIATFALGCFWGPDEYFSKLSGVLSTTVGYTGGIKEKPTYYILGDHTESVEIEFNPEKISYKELLDHFWHEHDPTYKTKTQYKSAIFVHDEEQKKVAEESLKNYQGKISGKIVTEIVPADTFYNAEDYHQKYLQKNRGAVC